MHKHICTIIAKNYISFARTLTSSFLKYHPGGKCYVLVIDDFEGYIDNSKEHFEIVTSKDLSLPRLQEFCFKYNITELSTAFKPYFLSYLLTRRKIEKILYLDPDILITNSMEGLFEALADSDIILTPHLDKDYPDDGLLPDDGHIMRSGIYNLGFIGVRKSENVNNFLAWWQSKLLNKCVIDHANGYFVDQKFIDLATVLFPNIKIIFDRGYNVAYWNLHSRKIHESNSIWMCNEGILYFYHFSNYKPEIPDRISGHQNRFKLYDSGGLIKLFFLYRDLLEQNGYSETKHWPYSYHHYSNGKVIKEVDRKVYRKMMHKISIKNPFNLESYPKQIRIQIFIKKMIEIVDLIIISTFRKLTNSYNLKI